ncbi:MAG: ABC transporter ATP-binding protein [Thermoplasmata archaeon]|nr:ABC transporter ATP-binding protein [Thermoplasmata archaeon]
MSSAVNLERPGKINKPIIKIEKMSKTFVSKDRKGVFKGKMKKVEALKEVDLEIMEGEIFGLLGPNGAGKTTLIKCLTTLLLPTSGQAEINGYNLMKEDNMVRTSMGCMLMGERGMYWKLTGRENLDYFGALYHIPKPVRKKKIDELIDLLKLQDFMDRTVETYSSGQKMILAFAKALINEAPILVLDEPTVTMDVHAARELREIVKDLNAKGHTILYTTHIMQEAEELCDRIAIIDKGIIMAIGTPEELKMMVEHEDIVTVEGIISKDAVLALKSIHGVKDSIITSEKNGLSVISVTCENSREILPGIIETITRHGGRIELISPETVSLEDVFIKLTGRSLSTDTREVIKEEKSGQN